MKGEINLQMPPFDTHESHLICLNLPLGIETVHGVGNNTQFSYFTSDGEGVVIHLRPCEAIEG